jgi:hypothetical protein
MRELLFSLCYYTTAIVLMSASGHWRHDSNLFEEIMVLAIVAGRDAILTLLGRIRFTLARQKFQAIWEEHQEALRTRPKEVIPIGNLEAELSELSAQASSLGLRSDFIAIQHKLHSLHALRGTSHYSLL